MTIIKSNVGFNRAISSSEFQFRLLLIAEEMLQETLLACEGNIIAGVIGFIIGGALSLAVAFAFLQICR